MLNRRYLHSLRLKIALTLLLLLIVTFAVTSYLRYASYERVLMENLELSAEHALGLIEDSLRDVVLAGDLATIEQATAELVKRHDLHSLTVLDSQGRTLVSLGEQGPYDAVPSRQANPGAGLLRTLPASGGGEIVLIGEHVRVYRTYGQILDQVRGASADADADVLAVLICDFTMAAVEARLAAYRQSRLLMTVGSMLAILAAADLMMSRIVVRRLGQILHGVTEVGAGNLPTEVPVAYRDEITELAEALNRMSAGLAQKERLEREVREGAVQLRTQAERLAALNNLSAAVSQSLNL
ncbi:MAG: HAMP domain-containing protein, partial [Chloroflexi bacterium]|nr:HAMP domain-containing protein [Chloroflexota bacterium]